MSCFYHSAQKGCMGNKFVFMQGVRAVGLGFALFFFCVSVWGEETMEEE